MLCRLDDIVIDLRSFLVVTIDVVDRLKFDSFMGAGTFNTRCVYLLEKIIGLLCWCLLWGCELTSIVYRVEVGNEFASQVQVLHFRFSKFEVRNFHRVYANSQ